MSSLTVTPWGCFMLGWRNFFGAFSFQPRAQATQYEMCLTTSSPMFCAYPPVVCLLCLSASATPQGLPAKPFPSTLCQRHFFRATEWFFVRLWGTPFGSILVNLVNVDKWTDSGEGGSRRLGGFQKVIGLLVSSKDSSPSSTSPLGLVTITWSQTHVCMCSHPFSSWCMYFFSCH